MSGIIKADTLTDHLGGNATESRKIVILTTARSSMIEGIVSDIQRTLLDFEIVMVTQRGRKTEIQEAFPTLLVIEGIPKGSFSLYKIAGLRLGNLRSPGAAAVILPYNNYHGRGYFYLKIVAFIIGAERVLCVRQLRYYRKRSFEYIKTSFGEFIINLALAPLEVVAELFVASLFFIAHWGYMGRAYLRRLLKQ